MDSNRQFREAVERYRHRIYTLAYYQLGSSEEAEDATQEVFIRLWQHWGEVSRRASVQPWLVRVARNHCIDLHRKRERARKTLVEGVHDDLLGAIPSDDGGPKAALEADRATARLEAAIRDLQEPYRSIVILREIEEWSYVEIAEGLDMSLDQIKVNLYRARRKLRKKLKEREPANDI